MHQALEAEHMLYLLARRAGIGNNKHLISGFFQLKGGLNNTNMRFDPGDDNLRFTALFDSGKNIIIAQAGKFEFGQIKRFFLPLRYANPPWFAPIPVGIVQ